MKLPSFLSFAKVPQSSVKLPEAVTDYNAPIKGALVPNVPYSVGAQDNTINYAPENPYPILGLLNTPHANASGNPNL
jgi:hypothetical protein